MKKPACKGSHSQLPSAGNAHPRLLVQLAPTSTGVQPRLRLGPFQISRFLPGFPRLPFPAGWRAKTLAAAAAASMRASSPHSFPIFLGVVLHLVPTVCLVEDVGCGGGPQGTKSPRHLVTSSPEEASQVEAFQPPGDPKSGAHHPRVWRSICGSTTNCRSQGWTLFFFSWFCNLSWYIVRAQILLFMARCNALDGKRNNNMVLPLECSALLGSVHV